MKYIKRSVVMGEVYKGREGWNAEMCTEGRSVLRKKVYEGKGCT